MTVVIVRISTQHVIDVRIASGSEKIVAASSPFVHAVVGQAVRDDRHHGTHIRQTTPQPVKSAHMACVQLLRPRRPKSLACVVEIPDVEIADLWSFRR